MRPLGLPWRVRPGTLVIEDAGGNVVANVRSGTSVRWHDPKDAVPREVAKKRAQFICDAVNRAAPNGDLS